LLSVILSGSCEAVEEDAAALSMKIINPEDVSSQTENLTERLMATLLSQGKREEAQQLLNKSTVPEKAEMLREVIKCLYLEKKDLNNAIEFAFVVNTEELALDGARFVLEQMKEHNDTGKGEILLLQFLVSNTLKGTKQIANRRDWKKLQQEIEKLVEPAIANVANAIVRNAPYGDKTVWQMRVGFLFNSIICVVQC